MKEGEPLSVTTHLWLLYCVAVMKNNERYSYRMKGSPRRSSLPRRRTRTRIGWKEKQGDQGQESKERKKSNEDRERGNNTKIYKYVQQPI
jgi:hypothetical protein